MTRTRTRFDELFGACATAHCKDEHQPGSLHCAECTQKHAWEDADVEVIAADAEKRRELMIATDPAIGNKTTDAIEANEKHQKQLAASRKRKVELASELIDRGYLQIHLEGNPQSR